MLREAWIRKLSSLLPSATTRVYSKRFLEENFCYGDGDAIFNEQQKALTETLAPTHCPANVMKLLSIHL